MKKEEIQKILSDESTSEIGKKIIDLYVLGRLMQGITLATKGKINEKLDQIIILSERGSEIFEKNKRNGRICR